MRISTTGLLALFNSFVARPSTTLHTSQLPETTSASPSYQTNELAARQEAWTKTLTFSVGQHVMVTEIIGSKQTATATLTMEDDMTVTVTGPSYTGGVYTYTKPNPDITFTGTPVLLNGATTTTFQSALEVHYCTKSLCEPSGRAITYSCPKTSGRTLAVTTTMQYYQCTSGQTCTATAFATTLQCGCGQSVCGIRVPFIPIPIAVIPPGGFIPPAPEPVVPTGLPPTLSISISQLTDTKTSSGMGSQNGGSSDVRTSSSTTSSSSSQSTSSKTSSSSSDACSLVSIGGNSDWQSTLTAWMAQFPFTLPSLTSSSSSTASSTTLTRTSSPASITATPTPTKAVSSSDNGAAGISAAFSLLSLASSISKARASQSSASMAASLSSVASASSFSKVVQSYICQHYGYNKQETEIPSEWHTDDYANPKCVADPKKINVDHAQWGSDWEFQPFNVDKGYDTNNPQKTLVEIWCQELVDKVNIEYHGKQPGVCQVYGKGECIRTENGQCAMYQHVSPAGNDASVLFTVSYKTGTPQCALGQTNEPTNYSYMGVEKCKKKLMDNIMNKCKVDKDPKVPNVFTGRHILGGSWRDGCMEYYIVARRHPPVVAW